MRHGRTTIGILAWVTVLSTAGICIAQGTDAAAIDSAVSAPASQAQPGDDSHEQLCDSLRELQRQFGNEFVLGCLGWLLNHKDTQVQTVAAYACGQIDLDIETSPIRFQLYSVLGYSGEQVSEWGAGQLPEFLAGEIVYGRPGLRYVKCEALRKLIPHNEAAVSILIKGLSSDSKSVRWHCAGLLGDYGEAGEAAIPRLIELVHVAPEEPPSEFDYNDEETRRVAVQSLGDIARNGEAVIPVLDSMLDDPIIEMRRDAAYALGQFGAAAEPAIPRLVELLNDPPCEGVFCATSGIPPEHWAGAALIRIGPESIPPLIDALSSEQPRIRRYAADALAFFGPDARDAIPALVEATQSDDADFRNQAIRSLGYLKLRPQLTVPALSQALQHEDVETRRRAAFALCLIGPAATTARAALQEALSDSDEDVRTSAAIALEDIEPDSSD